MISLLILGCVIGFLYYSYEVCDLMIANMHYEVTSAKHKSIGVRHFLIPLWFLLSAAAFYFVGKYL